MIMTDECSLPSNTHAFALPAKRDSANGQPGQPNGPTGPRGDPMNSITAYPIGEPVPSAGAGRAAPSASAAANPNATPTHASVA